MIAVAAAKLATTVVTMAAEPVTLDHRPDDTRYGIPDNEEDNAEGEDDVPGASADAQHTSRPDSPSSAISDSSEKQEDEEEESEDEDDELSADHGKPRSRNAVEQEANSAAESSASSESSEVSSGSDSGDAASDARTKWEGASEAADTAVSAEVESRNNCVWV